MFRKIRRSGPPMDPNTVAFQLKGAAMRIPYELIRGAMGKTYRGPVFLRPTSRGKSILVLEPETKKLRGNLTAWKSSRTSKSLIISAGAIVRATGKNREDFDGKEYRAKVEFGKILVSLSRCIRREING